MGKGQRALQPNYTLERTVMQRGRPVLAIDCVLGGAEREAVVGRSPKR